ncbi:MAG: hypothetical protein AAGC69_07985 [Paracraurococcus sp.]
MRHGARWAIAAMAIMAPCGILPAKGADLTIAVGGAFTSMDPHFFDIVFCPSDCLE